MPGNMLAVRSLRRAPAFAGPARAEIRFAAPPVARFVPAKAVGSFVPALTRKSFEKFGFSTATLITDWAGIAGAELARYSAPERLKWPRGRGEEDCDEGRPGAILVLRVDPARALDVEYRARQIIERINAYFGYRAVEAIRIVQAPLESRALLSHLAEGEPPSRRGGGRERGNPDSRDSGFPPPLTPSHKGEGNAQSLADANPLRDALARLERGVLRDQAAGR
jgi:hypothetical protein